MDQSSLKLDLTYTPAQVEFYSHPAQYKVLCKGRRFGATHSLAMHIVEEMVSAEIKVLWCDVIYSNISRYVQRYFLPILRQLPSDMYEWKEQLKQLTILKSVCDFRSADRPESLEGFSYHLTCLNECGITLKNRRLWNSSILPMSLDYDGKIILVGTPKGHYEKKLNSSQKRQESLYFELFSKGLDSNQSKWKSFRYTSYDNPLISSEGIHELEGEIHPPSLRRQEIYADFIDEFEDALFHREWFEIVDTLPAGSAFIVKIISLDTAFKAKEESDFSCGLVVYQTVNAFYIIDCINDKFEFPDLIRESKRLYEQYRPDAMLVEDRASGQSLIQVLKVETAYPVRAISPDKDKYTRACAITPVCESMKVKLLRGAWNEMFIDQLESFPSGSDDIVDSLSQALTYLKDWRGSKPKIVSRVITVPSQALRGYEAPDAPALDTSVMKGY